jgi:hypothetical protein
MIEAVMDKTPSCRIRLTDYLDAMFGMGAALATAWYLMVLALYPDALASLDFSPAAILLALLLTLPLHEGLHALTLWLVGIRAMKLDLFEYPMQLSFPKQIRLRIPLGVGITIGEPVTRNKNLATLLSPLAISPALLLLAPHMDGLLRGVLVNVSLFNILSCSGDVTLTLLLLSTSRDTIIRDEGQDLAVYGNCPPALFTRLLRSLGASGAVLFLMFIIVYPNLVLATFLSTSEQVTNTVRSAQANTTLYYDFYGLISLRVDVWRTPSSYGFKNSYQPGPLFLTTTFAAALAVGIARYRSLTRKAGHTTS